MFYTTESKNRDRNNFSPVARDIYSRQGLCKENKSMLNFIVILIKLVQKIVQVVSKKCIQLLFYNFFKKIKQTIVGFKVSKLS